MISEESQILAHSFSLEAIAENATLSLSQLSDRLKYMYLEVIERICLSLDNEKVPLKTSPTDKRRITAKSNYSSGKARD